MKKTLAILLALALVFSSITVSFAEETLTPAGQAAKDLGMLVGDANGVTQQYLNTAPTRIQAAVMILRLKGLLADAEKFTGTDNFADADKAAWAKPIMAYLKANPSVGYAGVGNNSFNPTATIDAKSYYVVMLQALGYKAGTDFTWDNAMTVAAAKGLKAVANVTNFTVNDLATATIETLKTNVAGGTTTLAAKLIADKVITQEAAVKAGVVTVAALAVSSVEAKSASSFVVKFNTAVDTAKAVITVKRNDVATAVTTAWNDAKTEATLTFAGILPEGDFVVAVKVDTQDLGSKTVTITKQKVAKIEILGTQLSVAPPTTVGATTTPGKGYATYKVFDQYGVDITSSPMANSSIGFNTSVGNGTGRNGLLTVTSFNTNVFITQFPTATVTAYCTDSAVSATKSLTVSLSQGTLGDITLNKITNVDNKDVKANDTISKFYIDFTATDINGTPTKDWTLIDNGMLYANTANKLLMTSNPTLLDARVTNDPADSNKAVIELVVRNGAIYQDMPVIITAMTKNGKSSSITVTVKKPSSLDKLTIMTPSVLVAAGDTGVVIPYEAFDQNGNVLTAYDDIVYNEAITGIASFTAYGDLKFTKNADGTLKITAGTTTASFVKNVPTVFQIVTRTGKSSMITIRPDEAKYANDLRIDSSVVKQYMQLGAKQAMDFGANYEGFEAIDQYGRVMDITGAADDSYYVSASVPAGSTILSITGPGKAFMGNKIEVVANGLGTETVTFKLMKKDTVLLPDGDLVDDEVATKSVVMAVIKDTDITGIKISSIATMYATATSTTGIASEDTAAVKAFNRTITVNGTVKGGALVKLNATSDAAVARFVDSSNFMVDGKNLRAKKLATGVAEAAAKVTATLPLNGTMLTATVDVKSTSAAPVAQSIALDYTVATNDVVSGSTLTGISVDGDEVTIDSTLFVANSYGSLLMYDAAGAANAGDVSFYVNDSYGRKGMIIPQLKVVSNGASNGATYSVNATTGMITATGTITDGDEFVITAVANNGMTKTVKFIVK